MNEVVCMKNRVTLNWGGKRQVKNFTRQEFWKYIGCILLASTYGKKGCKLWSEVSKDVGKHENQILRRYVRGTTDLQKVRKVDERLAGRVISCFEEYSKISWRKSTTGHWLQVQV